MNESTPMALRFLREVASGAHGKHTTAGHRVLPVATGTEEVREEASKPGAGAERRR